MKGRNGGKHVTTGYVILETGEIFPGTLIGNRKSQTGEIVFNTSMTGYQEIITDPSYAGQIIVFSYPLIGNYGMNHLFTESDKPHVRGIVTGEICGSPSHYQLAESATTLLEKYGIPCLTDVDTRALVKTIRKKGTVKAIISDRPDVKPVSSDEKQLVKQVTTKELLFYDNEGPHVVLVDFGYKKSILAYLQQIGCKVTVVPFDYPFEKIRSLNPDGIVLSNGPGNPIDLADHLDKIHMLTQCYPTLGICLGHQLIALAYGAKTEKLPFGHRGANHPVKDLRTGKVFITSQNHGYVVIDGTMNENEFTVTFQHVNDRTIEGFTHKTLPIQTVQFHPEAHPGPQDTEYIFHNFIESIQKIGEMKYAVK